MNTIPLVLSSFAEIFIRDNYCSLVHHKRGNIEILHPSEAFILSLLNGTVTGENLVPIFSATYNISRDAATSITSAVMRKLKDYLVRSDGSKQRARYDSQAFLFPGFDKKPNLDTPLSKPQMLGLALTTQCNFRCRYCSLGGNAIAPQNLEKDLALRVINEAAELGVVHASFGGWEPLLYPDICEIVAAITGRGMVLLFSTNGSLLDERMVAGLVKAGLKGIQVSLDAATAEIHHYITRTENTFNKVVSGINRLKAQGIWVKTRSVITPLSLNSVPFLVDMLVDMDVDQITLGPQHRGSCEVRCENSTEILDPLELESLQNMIREKAAQYPDREIIYGNLDRSWQGQKDVLFCAQPARGIMVAVNGDVLPCEMIHDKYLLWGNVRESTLDEIWLGPGHRKFLEMALNPTLIDPDCNRCQKLQDCHTGCFNLSKIETGNYFSKDPRCPGPDKMRMENT